MNANNASEQDTRDILMRLQRAAQEALQRWGDAAAENREKKVPIQSLKQSNDAPIHGIKLLTKMNAIAGRDTKFFLCITDEENNAPEIVVRTGDMPCINLLEQDTIEIYRSIAEELYRSLENIAPTSKPS